MRKQEWIDRAGNTGANRAMAEAAAAAFHAYSIADEAHKAEFIPQLLMMMNSYAQSSMGWDSASRVRMRRTILQSAREVA